MFGPVPFESARSEEAFRRGAPSPHPALRIAGALRLAVAAVLLVVLAGCDPAVDPVRDNGLDYSFFGYLDAAADTQYVRIERLRDGRPRSAPRDLDAEVRLTNLATGRTIALRDSLFHFFPRGTAHNFYTTTDVAPRTSYRLVATGPNDTRSEARATLPAVPTVNAKGTARECSPDCVTMLTGPPCTVEFEEGAERSATVEVGNVKRLVAAKAVYHMGAPEGTYVFDHLADTTRVDNATYDVRVVYREDVCTIPPPPPSKARTVEKIEIVVAAGGPEWPDFAGLGLTEEQLPTAVSNVEGGVGLFVGVVTDTVTVYP